MNLDAITFNGINGATGDYLFPTLSPQEISRIIRGENREEKQTIDITKFPKPIGSPQFAPGEGIDPRDLAKAGWGVIFSQNYNPQIKEALSPLLEHRQRTAAATNHQLYREFTGPSAYRKGESKQQFLSRNGVGPGPVNPFKMPYYLLLVGDPESIPFKFQYQLDVQYAVGRIHFDTLDEYARYAKAVLRVETEPRILPRQVTFFGARNIGDLATQLSADHLIKPLVAKIQEEEPTWNVDSYLADQASKSLLNQLIGGSKSTTLFFSACHGMGFPQDDPRQLLHQGSLLCQDWPGPLSWRKPIPQDFYLAADDIPESVNLSGVVAFFFACYGAGTPKLDEFARQSKTDRTQIAPYAFLARLPQRMLALGALAVVGHIERAWGVSFLWGRAGEQLSVFESVLRRLLNNYPVGSAVEYFNERYAELSSDLSSELEDISCGKTVDDLELAAMWTANNDARNYVVIGDPAVRLCVRDPKGAPGSLSV